MKSRERETAVRSAALLFLGMALLTGCTDTRPAPTAPVAQELRLTPGIEATGVKLNASVTLTLATAVDRATVERGMHLIAEPTMYEYCPDPSMGYPGSMQEVMMDPAMMKHMDERHSTAGHFAWNSAGTICTFHPDSLLLPQTRYMVHLSPSVVHMGAMMGNCYTNSGGDIMTHFHTVSAGR